MWTNIRMVKSLQENIVGYAKNAPQFLFASNDY